MREPANIASSGNHLPESLDFSGNIVRENSRATTENDLTNLDAKLKQAKALELRQMHQLKDLK